MPDIMKMGKNPYYLGSWDLEEVPGHEITLTISKITDETVTGAEGRKENCAVCYFQEPGYLPMILNLTNKKTLVKLYKTKETEKLRGKRITITTEKVKAFGGIHDALRIKPVVPAAANVPNEICENCGGEIIPSTKMTSKQIAAYGKQKFGKALCAKCAKAATEQAEAPKTEQEKTE